MSSIKLGADSGGGTVALKGPASTTGNASVELRLPVADGSANQVLATNGSGQLQWADDTDTTNTNASNLSSGTLPDARFPATLPAVSGANLTGISSPLSFRNLIYNGEMMINQRGTTATINGYGGPDRWKTSVSQAAFTASKDSESPPGFNSSLKLDCTTAATLTGNNSIQIQQHLEGQDLQSLAAGTSSAKSLTLSFWVRSTKTGVFNTHIYQKDGGKLVSQNTTISSANTWEKKTFTVSGNTADTIANDNTKSLTIEFWLDSGPDNKGGTITNSWAASASNKYGEGVTLNIGDNTSNNFYLTGVQLETGSTATDFEHRSYDDELSRCQRYFQVFHKKIGVIMRVHSSTQALTHIPLIKSMRDVPTYAIAPSSANYDLLYGGAVLASQSSGWPFSAGGARLGGFELMITRSSGTFSSLDTVLHANLQHGYGPTGFEYFASASAEL